MTDIAGFPPIQGVFFATFHPTEGTKALHYVPESLITIERLDDFVNKGSDGPELDSQTDVTTEFLIAHEETPIKFDDITKYVIPKDEFCNRIMSVKYKDLRIMGYPVSIVHERYNRNSFKFNICLVLSYEEDSTCYEPVVTRLGRMFEVLERQLQILSRSAGDSLFFLADEGRSKDRSTGLYQILGTVMRNGSTNDGFSIQSMIEQLYQDLNDYSECLIQINEESCIDIKLFPDTKLPDVNLLPCDVPISTIDLERIVDFSWDPNMRRVVRFIDGVNNVRRIAALSNADYGYTCLCIKHLMAFKCIILLDTFLFQNIYAVTSKAATFLDRYDVLAEQCIRYCYSGKETNPVKGLPFETDTRTYSAILADSESVLSFNDGRARSRRGGSHETFDKESAIKTEVSLAALYLYDSSHARGQYGDSVDSTGRTTSFISLNAYDKNRMLGTLQVFELYTSFRQSRTVEAWYRKNRDLLRFVDIDVRRFVAFGLLQGLLYRVYTYPMLLDYTLDWLLNCDIYYLKKDESYLLGFNQRLTNFYRDTFDTDRRVMQTEKEMQAEIDRLLEDEKYFNTFNDTHNLKPLQEKEILSRNYGLHKYRIKRFNEPTELEEPIQDVASEYDPSSEIRSRLGGSSYTRTEHKNNGAPVTLELLRSPDYIKLIKIKSLGTNEEEQYYSLKSILTLKKEYLDKIKHFDVICTDFGVDKKTAARIMKTFWTYHVVEK